MSNRLTFSLASLILLFAFVAMPVMAHDNASGDDATTPRPHSHPLETALDAATDAADITAGRAGIAVATHGHHPVPTITLKADAARIKDNEIVVTGETTGTTDVFSVIITFDRAVGTSPTDTAAAPTPIDSGSFSVLVLDKDGNPITGGATIASSTEAALADDNEAVVTVATAGLPAAGDTHTIRLRLNRGATGVSGLQTERVDGVTVITTPGADNNASEIVEYKLVRELTPAPRTPKAPAMRINVPDEPAANGDVVFTIDFDQALGTGPSGLQINDFTITGGTGVLAEVDPLPESIPDIDEETVKERHMLTVTPTATSNVSVSIALNPDTVANASGDTIVPGTSTMATYDKTPPTVTITAPTEPDADGKLLFTFEFSEELASGADGFDIRDIDRSGSDNVRLLDGGPKMADDSDAMMPTYELLVTPADPKVDTTVLLLAGAVTDTNGNELASDAYATYTVPVTNTPPVFETMVPTLNGTPAGTIMWCQGENRGNMAILLPRARDSETDDLTYSLHAADGTVATEIPENPNPVPTSSLYWVTVDVEQRYLRGAAQVSDGPAPNGLKYTWQVTDEHGARAVVPVEFTIVVHPYAKPKAVTGVTAMKVDGIATVGDDVDKVRLNWTNPNPAAAQPKHADGTDCIPAVTHYIVTTQELNTHTQGRTAKGAAVTTTLTVAQATNMDGNLEYITDKLGHGTYEFTVTARNRAGDSPVSAKAIWDRTNYHWVIVDDPPVASTNLRADQTAEPRHSVTLSWIPPTHDPNAPVNDTKTGLAMALYGVPDTFGGYTIEVTNQSNSRVTVHPSTDVIPPAGDSDVRTRTYTLSGLARGEYTARVIAHNVVGAGALSNSQAFEIDVHQPGEDTPDNNAPVFADGASIERIDATVGVAFDGRILPTATDADGDRLIYSLTPRLPAGLTFNASNQSITGTPTAVSAAAVYTYTVSDGKRGTASLRFFIAVKAATEGPPPTSTPTAMLPANGFIVYVRDINNPPHFGTSNPMVAEWAAMPNLYELFNRGGGGSLQLNVTGVNARQVVFSEVMWAVDLGKVGQDSYDGNQWIELRNRTANAIPITSISFAVKADGRPALPQGTDLISNVVGGGDDWIKDGKGQNGNSGATVNGVTTGQTPFKSMIRTRYHNDSAGWNAGEWKTADQVYHPNHYGTPGTAEPQTTKVIGRSSVRGETIFNEISNSSTGDHEWIELRKREGELSNLENWVVDMVTGASDRDVTTNPTQTRLFKIPKLNDGRYGDILLITRTDPARDDSHPLRGGYNVEVNPADQENEGRDKNIRYYVADDWTTDLPDDGNFVLILRHGADKTNHEKVEDLAGYHPNLKVERGDFFSNLWPLTNYHAPDIALNKIEVNKVHRRQKDNIPGTRTADKKDNADHVALRDIGWTGVGYKRNANAGAKNGGTPGYPNNALASNETAASGDPVIISEIMYSTGDRGNFPQWIELYNTSQTVGVNLDGWRITIVNHDQDSADSTFKGDLSKSYNINGKIPPGQTFLIVAHSGTDNTNLPSERIESIRSRRGDLILSQYGFEITLETRGKDGKDANRKLADKVGNLGSAEGRRSQSFADTTWDLPAGTNEEGDRVSITRVNGSTGLNAASWKSFGGSSRESTYYGNRNDDASPGYVDGGVLPVSLSKFRPERLDDGSIRIGWVTESETNNAGFNILRGEAIDGEFKQINTKLIAGQGTTSERTVYTYTDPSAKPNVVYYYQIQDVSLDGQVQTLRITHLRGNVSAAGKLTTTWGELKALQ
ncbi:MAG: lamin tail domain-containing protein [Candidatus Poribacteria bacterium]|nr:lamin tail domain-containing protein [Candidatus Poribacteria bacterium]